MSKRVLSIGQCVPDHTTLTAFFSQQFDAEVVATDELQSATEKLEQGSFDLILVNRKLDVDYSDGVEIIRELKQNIEYRDLPMMMVTNYPEHQQIAVEAGAEPGFGKLELEQPGTVERLKPFLSSD